MAASWMPSVQRRCIIGAAAQSLLDGTHRANMITQPPPNARDQMQDLRLFGRALDQGLGQRGGFARFARSERCGGARVLRLRLRIQALDSARHGIIR